MKALFCSWLALFSISCTAGLLEDIVQKNSEKEYIEGRFVQEKHIDIIPLPILSEGSFSFGVRQGLIWEIKAPSQKKIEISKNCFCINGVAVEDSYSDSVEVILFGLLSGRLDMIESFFNFSASGKPTNWTIKLTPKQAATKEFIRGIALFGSDQINRIQIAEKNGDITVISITYP